MLDEFQPVSEETRAEARIAVAEWVAHHRENPSHFPQGQIKPPGWKCLNCDDKSSSLGG